MKQTFLVAALLLALSMCLEARTWTSADGSSTFEGELRSFDPNSGMVRIVRTDGRLVNFDQSLLSSADREFLETAKRDDAEPADMTEQLEQSKIGKLVAKAKLQKLDGKRFRSAEMTKAPEYYILYFSASW